jgi:hypothetical protein|tara:strand:+ start:3033 stop:3209 length:177 start_codon:yes stop_codon:yes gene_type:complete
MEMNIKKLLLNLNCDLALKAKSACQLILGIKKEEGSEERTFLLTAKLYPIELKLVVTY